MDSLDETRRTGWSVLVRGRTAGIVSPDEVNQLCAVEGAVPWAGGIRNLFIGITVREITGREFGRRADDD